MEWITSGEKSKLGAGRKKEKLKSHAKFRNFLRPVLDRDKKKFGLTYEGLTVRGEIFRDLEAMDRRINDSNEWNFLAKMTEQNRQEKLQATVTLNPEEETNIRESINTWNQLEIRLMKAQEVINI